MGLTTKSFFACLPFKMTRIRGYTHNFFSGRTTKVWVPAAPLHPPLGAYSGSKQIFF